MHVFVCFRWVILFPNIASLFHFVVPETFTPAPLSRDHIIIGDVVINSSTGTRKLDSKSIVEKINKSSKDQPRFVIPAGYEKENRPMLLSNEPILVWFDIHVVAINPIKSSDMDFRMDMTLSQRWTDARLKFGNEWFDDNHEFFILPQEYTDKIWHPDPYIVNAKSTDIGQLTQKLVSVYIFRNQTVHYITNVFVTVACAMNYKYYPYDHQVCPMYIESFSYDETQVKYVWANEDDAFTINTKAVDFWMGGCLIWVFGSLGEYVIVKVLFSVTEDVKFDYYEKRRFREEVDRTEEGNHANGEPANVMMLNENEFHTFSYRRHRSTHLSSRFDGTFAVDNYYHHCHPQRSFSIDESIYLDKAVLGKLRIPLQWTDSTNGRTVLLWTKIDDFSKWFFPLTFFIFCSLYWLVLYLHYISTKVQPYSRIFNLNRSACIE